MKPHEDDPIDAPATTAERKRTKRKAGRGAIALIVMFGGVGFLLYLLILLSGVLHLPLFGH
jgi:hypothetical protein